ncbi:uncharacterized protein EV420DRAFT_1479544 [Desarmillaria tabescens]|uniref:Uncharacterized protein n=1 Tax=Armillaria tabescens TaxID=1929756 RepID=A0AA39KCY9_ARMTA|nr:uncharacterized protein EV420DRAFT_1479544 [Desarmillaria tabescens]KAK0458879.1 hypothetical protein EV420DRAFT_1479544 [Desarmillaria tabescens]
MADNFNTEIILGTIRNYDNGLGYTYLMTTSKPVSLAIVEYASGKPVIGFTPLRRQRRFTVNLLLLHCSADDKTDGFLNVEVTGLKETSKKGIGYFHEVMDKEDKWIVQRLFENGVVQAFFGRGMVGSCC